MLSNVKKNDQVLVIAGKDKGKRGNIIDVFPKKGKVRVKGVAILTKHSKPKRQGEAGALVKTEGLVDLSNVMLICAACNKPSRVGVKLVDANGKKVRECRRCEQSI